MERREGVARSPGFPPRPLGQWQFQELRKDGGKDRLEIQSVMGTGPGGEGGFGLVGHIVRLWEVG